VPVENIVNKSFDIKTFTVMQNMEEMHYTISIDRNGLNIANQSSQLTKKDSLTTFIMFVCIALAIIIVALTNALTKSTRWKLLIFYGILFGLVAISSLLDGRIRNDSIFILFACVFTAIIGGIIGAAAGIAVSLSTDENANTHHNTVIHSGGLAGMFTGMMICLVITMFTAQYGWSSICINDYLIFISGVCLISFLLREIVAFFMRRKNASAIMI
jgi:hypothetical protein